MAAVARCAAASWAAAFWPLLGRAAASGAAHGGGSYVLQDAYVGSDFFSKWWFWHWPDVTHGQVDFLPGPNASEEGLINATKDRVFIGVDSQSRGRPRRSVKIYSNEVYNSGLFIITLDHMPTGCGTWPAFWMTGGDWRDWPAWGEFDIIEGVHENVRVATALHTTRGCQQSAVMAGRDFTGEWQEGISPMPANDCYIKAPEQWWNQGCGQIGPNGSIGRPFNAGGGGTYAAQWDPNEGHFRVWFWPRGREPPDVRDGEPAPTPWAWGTPYSLFQLGNETCSPSHFRDMRLVFDLTFCGDMGSALYQSHCPADAAKMTCEELVANHPERFQEAYWSIRRLDVYQWQKSVLPTTSSTTTATATTTAAPAADEEDELENIFHLAVLRAMRGFESRGHAVAGAPPPLPLVRWAGAAAGTLLAVALLAGVSLGRIRGASGGGIRRLLCSLGLLRRQQLQPRELSVRGEEGWELERLTGRPGCVAWTESAEGQGRPL